MKDFLKRLLLAVPVLAILSIGSVFLSAMLNELFLTHSMRLFGFEECIELIKNNEKCFQWWILLELLSVAVAVLLLFTRSDYYTSRLIKITDKISIPASAGQGQHGTARFMSKREKLKYYKPLRLDKSDTVIKELMMKGDERKKEVKAFEKIERKKRRLKAKSEHLQKRIDKKRKKEETQQDKALHGRNTWEKNRKKQFVIKVKYLRKIIWFKRRLRHIKKKLFSSGRYLMLIKNRFLWFWQDRLFNLSCLKFCLVIRCAVCFAADKKYRAAVLKLPKIKAVKDKKKVCFENNYFKVAGLVVNANKDGTKISCITDDKHVVVIGATGTGKTRRLVIPTVCSLALAGESMVVTDPKGEISAYTADFLKSLGYKVIVMNFFDMSVSSSMNPLQPVIDAVNAGDDNLAVTRTREIAEFLVEKANGKTEPIWRNGELSIISGAILCVVYDNKEHPQYQNLTNVYAFIENMCKDVKIGNANIKPIVKYIQEMPDNHPAKLLFGISEVAPDKTAGSFYTSALTTLNLFTSQDIYSITNKSDFNFENLGKEKQVLFFVLPDSNTAYYPIVSLFCSQIYDVLTQTAKYNGNRLKNRVNFILDEFGNFSTIKDFSTMLTVGRGYGIRYNLFLQSFAQLEEKYEKTGERIIKDNCIWFFLGAGNHETLKDFEERLGKYTTSSYSLGNSTQRRTQPSSSSNVNLMGRSLLTSDEVGRIKDPYVLISEAQQDPVVFQLPDLSKLCFNRILGLGSRNHNKILIQFSNSKQIPHVEEEMQMWGIWKNYTGQNLKISTERKNYDEILI